MAIVNVGCTHDRPGDLPIEQTVLIRDRNGDAAGRACPCVVKELLELGAEYAGPRRRRFLRVSIELPRYFRDTIKDPKAANREHKAAAGIDHGRLRWQAPPKKAPACGSRGRMVVRDELLHAIGDWDRIEMAEARRKQLQRLAEEAKRKQALEQETED